MLKDLLEQKKCFKLVCGAGNEDIIEVEKLVRLYSMAGCSFFDISANLDVLEAAKKGIELSGVIENRYICVSVGIDGDPHITKASIDTEKCIKCGLCQKNCLHEAIVLNEVYEVQKERCLGCNRCEKICPQNAIHMYSQLKNYKEILPALIDKGIDCIEFHAISNDINDIMNKWQQINELYDGMLCISVDRSVFGDKKLLEIINQMLSIRKPYTTIIQADGIAMSGNDDELGTTLQAIATVQLFQNAKFSAYIMMSGGTNIKSTMLANQCKVYPHCLAVGSYARKIVKKYLELDNLFENEIVLNEAIKIAKNLIDVSLEYMG